MSLSFSVIFWPKITKMEQKMNKPKSLYLNKPQLKAELDRCLNCKNAPCMNACPVNCNPQEFINCAKQENFPDSIKAITRNNPLGQTCGLICPDKFCMAACTRSHIDFAINIPKVQATILHNHRAEGYCNLPAELNGKKAAVIGAGPAGIAAAAELAKMGYLVTMFEAAAKIGGALNMIPETRLPHDVIEKDWNFVCHKDRVELHLNSIQTPEALLKKGYAGVIVATGEPHCTILRIPGEELCVTFMDYLREPQKYASNGRVAVIGGGNVAADCAFTAHEQGASAVELFVRRQLSDMKITRSEIFELMDRQVDFTTMTSPEKIEKKNGALSLFTRKNQFVDGKLVPLADSTIERPGFDLIIKAVGSFAERFTDGEKIIYAGDCKHGGSTVVEAIASGREAAANLDEALK